MNTLGSFKMLCAKKAEISGSTQKNSTSFFQVPQPLIIIFELNNTHYRHDQSDALAYTRSVRVLHDRMIELGFDVDYRP